MPSKPAAHLRNYHNLKHTLRIVTENYLIRPVIFTQAHTANHSATLQLLKIKKPSTVCFAALPEKVKNVLRLAKYLKQHVHLHQFI